MRDEPDGISEGAELVVVMAVDTWLQAWRIDGLRWVHQE